MTTEELLKAIENLHQVRSEKFFRDLDDKLSRDVFPRLNEMGERTIQARADIDNHLADKSIHVISPCDRFKEHLARHWQVELLAIGAIVTSLWTFFHKG